MTHEPSFEDLLDAFIKSGETPYRRGAEYTALIQYIEILQIKENRLRILAEIIARYQPILFGQYADKRGHAGLQEIIAAMTSWGELKQNPARAGNSDETGEAR